MDKTYKDLFNELLETLDTMTEEEQKEFSDYSNRIAAILKESNKYSSTAIMFFFLQQMIHLEESTDSENSEKTQEG